LVILVVVFGLHPVLDTLAAQALVVLGFDIRVFHPIGDGGAAFGEVHAGVVDMSLAGRAGLAARRMRPEPGGQSQRLLGGAEMLVIPPRPARRRRHHADRLVVDAPALARLAPLPWPDAVPLRPGLSV